VRREVCDVMWCGVDVIARQLIVHPPRDHLHLHVLVGGVNFLMWHDENAGRLCAAIEAQVRTPTPCGRLLAADSLRRRSLFLAAVCEGMQAIDHLLVAYHSLIACQSAALLGMAEDYAQELNRCVHAPAFVSAVPR
jgi:hypothetical protein